jgi:hypothetical protein
MFLWTHLLEVSVGQNTLPTCNMTKLHRNNCGNQRNSKCLIFKCDAHPGVSPVLLTAGAQLPSPPPRQQDPPPPPPSPQAPRRAPSAPPPSKTFGAPPPRPAPELPPAALPPPFAKAAAAPVPGRTASARVGAGAPSPVPGKAASAGIGEAAPTPLPVPIGVGVVASAPGPTQAHYLRPVPEALHTQQVGACPVTRGGWRLWLAR